MTTSFQIELPYTWNFALESALRKAMKTYWKESLQMSSKTSIIKPEDVYWSDMLDLTADILLQVMEQRKQSKL